MASGALLNFETATSHSVKVRVTDGGGLTFDKTFNIGVTDVDEAPTNIALSGDTVVENSANGTVIGALTETDPDTSDTAAFTLVDDAGGRFAISGNDLVVADGSLLDFESNTSHSVTVRATDSGGLTLDKVFNIAVSDIDETIGGTPHWMKNVFNPAHPAGWLPAPDRRLQRRRNERYCLVQCLNRQGGYLEAPRTAHGSAAPMSDRTRPAINWSGAVISTATASAILIWFDPTTRDLDLWKITDGHWAGSVDIGIPSGRVTCRAASATSTATAPATSPGARASTGEIDPGRSKNGHWSGSATSARNRRGYDRRASATSTAMVPATSPGTIRQQVMSTSGRS